jgi:uncharacterized protein (TIGR02145 family)
MSVGNQESIDYRGTTEGLALKATSNWFSPNGNVNSSGFTALPGGFRDYVGVSFGLGYYGGWWSRTENDFFSAWYRSLNFSYSNVFRGNYYKNSGNSVRCLKD